MSTPGGPAPEGPTPQGSAPGGPASGGTAPEAPSARGSVAGVPAAGVPAPQGTAARHPIPPWMFALAMLVVLEPPILIAAWAADTDLADGHLIAIALVGGLFISLPSLAIFGLAVMWDRRLSGGRTVPGLPAGLTGARASKVSSISLAVSTILLGAVIAILLGPWALVALPPLALSLVSAWLMARAA